MRLGTINDYKQYTKKVMEYAGQFQRERVLYYDQTFRHNQANGKLCWKDDNQHLVTVHLLSPVHKGTPFKQPRYNRGENKQPTRQCLHQFVACLIHREVLHGLGPVGVHTYIRAMYQDVSNNILHTCMRITETAERYPKLE